MASDTALLDGENEDLSEPNLDDEDWDVEWGDIMANMNGAGGRARARQSAEKLEEVAAKAGWGRMYAAFGGGEEGLSACAAGLASWLYGQVSCGSVTCLRALTNGCERTCEVSEEIDLPDGAWQTIRTISYSSSCCAVTPLA